LATVPPVAIKLYIPPPRIQLAALPFLSLERSWPSLPSLLLVHKFGDHRKFITKKDHNIAPRRPAGEARAVMVVILFHKTFHSASRVAGLIARRSPEREYYTHPAARVTQIRVLVQRQRTPGFFLH
jgi:hypothetical protein